ncbi:MAG: dihydroneopterin aldolase [Sandaracinaceae bacterium]|nr:dihydroneopterin aldolase [Sandaracinaceae bacterium]
MSATDVIAIAGLRIDCVVGVYPHERDRAQPLDVHVRMRLDTRRAGTSERLAHTVHYAEVANQIAFLLQSCRFDLLETAAHVLSRHLLAPPAPGERRARVEEVALRLEKPYALAGHGVPSLEVTRHAREVTLTQEKKRWGTVDVVHETRRAGVYRLNVAPHRGIPLHVHQTMREAELVLGAGLHCQQRPVAAGTIFRWPRGAAHRWDNPTADWQSILCVDSPPFIPADEVEVEGEPAPVRPQAPFIPIPVER